MYWVENSMKKRPEDQTNLYTHFRLCCKPARIPNFESWFSKQAVGHSSFERLVRLNRLPYILFFSIYRKAIKWKKTFSGSQWIDQQKWRLIGLRVIAFKQNCSLLSATASGNHRCRWNYNLNLLQAIILLFSMAYLGSLIEWNSCRLINVCISVSL